MEILSGAVILQFPKIYDPRGNLTFIEENNQIPFEIKRVYWIFDVPGGEVRGGHAFRKNEEVIISLSGSFDVLVDYGDRTQIFSLNRSYFGLYIPKMIWRQLIHFSTNSVALVIASTPYDDRDYVHQYDEYIGMKRR